MPEKLNRCEQHTKRKWVNGGWVNEPGKCGNLGRHQFGDMKVCGNHLKMLNHGLAPKPVSKLERLAREVSDKTAAFDRGNAGMEQWVELAAACRTLAAYLAEPSQKGTE